VPLYNLRHHSILLSKSTNLPIAERPADPETACVEIILDTADFLRGYEWIGETQYREWFIPPEVINARTATRRIITRRELSEIFGGVLDLRVDLHAQRREQLEALAILVGAREPSESSS